MRKQKSDLLYYIKQKLLGLAMVLISILIPLLTQDATITVIILPMGLYALFTRNKIIV